MHPGHTVNIIHSFRGGCRFSGIGLNIGVDVASSRQLEVVAKEQVW
jgi:hypothetical protein